MRRIVVLLAAVMLFTFPAFSLCGGCSVHVRTGTGTNGAKNLYWGLGNYVWNNTGLVKPTGVIRDTCAYTGTTALQGVLR